MLNKTSRLGRLFWRGLATTAFLARLHTTPVFGAAPEPPLQELLDVLKTNLPALSAQELEQATTAGLLKQLGDKVRIPESGDAAGNTTNQPLVANATVFDQEIGYLRVAKVGPGLAEEIQKSWQTLLSSNRVAAVVIDLRNAAGTDFQSAGDAADQFLSAEKPMFKAGDKTLKASKGEKDITVPLVVLVNKETKGAAEALAGALRQGRDTLALGSKTAGAARLYQEFTLSSGARVEIAKGWVEFPNGQSIPESGMEPDLQVPVTPELEKTYLENPFWGTADRTQAIDGGRGSNTVSRRLINEAELMRRQRGEQLTPDLGPNPLPSKPVIADPVLARGVDFLKGVLVFQKKAGPAVKGNFAVTILF